jgi:anti-sigma B factor antagonist
MHNRFSLKYDSITGNTHQLGGWSMEIIEEKQGGINIFKLNGRLDSNTSQGFEQKIFQAITDGSKNMVVDFKDLDYISSAGLRVILKATKAIKREDGRIMLCAMQDYVKEVFEIAGFDSFLPIVATMDDALKAF